MRLKSRTGSTPVTGTTPTSVIHLTKYRGIEQLVARRAHNPEVVWFKSHPRNQKETIHSDGFSFWNDVFRKRNVMRLRRDAAFGREVCLRHVIRNTSHHCEQSEQHHCAKHNITPLPPENKIWYNTLYLAGKVVCKKDEKTSSLLCFDIKLLYGRCAKGRFCFLPTRNGMLVNSQMPSACEPSHAV